MEKNKQVYLVSSPAGLPYAICSSIELANKRKEELYQKISISAVLSPVPENVILFDEGRKNVVIDKDKEEIYVNGDFSFLFFIPDLSSLLFELRLELSKARNNSLKNDVRLYSKAVEAVMTVDEAQTLLDFLEAKMDELRKKENEWFDKHDGSSIELISLASNVTNSLKDGAKLVN